MITNLHIGVYGRLGNHLNQYEAPKDYFVNVSDSRRLLNDKFLSI